VSFVPKDKGKIFGQGVFIVNTHRPMSHDDVRVFVSYVRNEAVMVD
jgi:hypothetical protein